MVSLSAPTSSCPSSLIDPAMRAFLAVCRPITAMLVTDLPDPDSPTMPSVWPRSTWKDNPSTDFTTPSSVVKCTCRSRTSRCGCLRQKRRCGWVGSRWSSGPHSRVEDAVHEVDDQVAQRDGNCGHQQDGEHRRKVVRLGAVMASCPRPGSPKTVSVSTAPPISRPKSRPKMVTIGVRAPRRPCLTTTLRSADPSRAQCGCSPPPWSPACPPGCAGRTARRTAAPAWSTAGAAPWPTAAGCR